ncbi:hypothetical protein QAD02_001621 [Eretmocerus hayati]|uniref:Uncharacterized protein n=1 Tax=Eretmocerus hayati TaxID=131215 RepID=A0ACC2NJE7_9HYME|nr:hypothetical protein QAD02_001621 [Eretmocerus hayati]
MQRPPTTLRNPFVLQNGGLISTGKRVTIERKNLHKINLYLQLTCPFDSITEIITHSYRFLSDFREAVDNWKSLQEAPNPLGYASTIQAYACGTPTALVYSYRAHLCANYYSVTSSSFIPNKYFCNCKDAIAAALRKLMDTYNGPVSHEVCNNCSKKDRFLVMRNTCVFDVDDSIVTTQYETQEQTYHELLSSQQMFDCLKCFTRSLERRFVLGPYICFDTSYAHRHGHKSKLSAVPRELILVGKKYILSGIVQYTPHDKHFIALCLSPTTGSWKVKNDLAKRSYDLHDDPQISIAMIFYVRVSTFQPVSGC